MSPAGSAAGAGCTVAASPEPAEPPLPGGAVGSDLAGRKRTGRWTTDTFATALRGLTLDLTDRTLRTTAPRNQHPFVRLDLEPASWRAQVRELVQSLMSPAGTELNPAPAEHRGSQAAPATLNGVAARSSRE